jgi:hypothetical protein
VAASALETVSSMPESRTRAGAEGLKANKLRSGEMGVGNSGSQGLSKLSMPTRAPNYGRLRPAQLTSPRHFLSFQRPTWIRYSGNGFCAHWTGSGAVRLHRGATAAPQGSSAPPPTRSEHRQCGNRCHTSGLPRRYDGCDCGEHRCTQKQRTNEPDRQGGRDNAAPQ